MDCASPGDWLLFDVRGSFKRAARGRVIVQVTRVSGDLPELQDVLVSIGSDADLLRAAPDTHVPAVLVFDDGSSGAMIGRHIARDRIEGLGLGGLS